MPIDLSLKSQILSFLGIIISAVIALSSTTLLEDFSVTYKIHGFLEDSSKYFSTSSLLISNVLRSLYNSDIEIASPTFMNQRQVNDILFIPEKEIVRNEIKSEKSLEDLVFDKATQAETIEKKKEYLSEIDQKK